jgi:hypothetical protein
MVKGGQVSFAAVEGEALEQRGLWNQATFVAKPDHQPISMHA